MRHFALLGVALSLLVTLAPPASAQKKQRLRLSVSGPLGGAPPPQMIIIGVSRTQSLPPCNRTPCPRPGGIDQPICSVGVTCQPTAIGFANAIAAALTSAGCPAVATPGAGAKAFVTMILPLLPRGQRYWVCIDEGGTGAGCPCPPCPVINNVCDGNLGNECPPGANPWVAGYQFACETRVPALSDWGLVALGLLVTGAAIFFLARRTG